MDLGGARLTKGLVAALAAVALCAAALPSTAAAFKPLVGKFSASIPGTVTQNTMTLETSLRNRTYTTRVLRLTDDCAASTLAVPVSLGRLFAKDFKYQSTTTSGTISNFVDIDGLFTGAKQATARLHTTSTNLSPPPGSPPSAAKLCDDITTFTLRYTGGGKKKKGR